MVITMALNPQCAGPYDNGNCYNYARRGSRYCYQHEPATLAAHAERKRAREAAQVALEASPKRLCAKCRNRALVDDDHCWRHTGEYENYPLCHGTRRDGKPCTKRLVHGFGNYCQSHWDQDRAKTRRSAPREPPLRPWEPPPRDLPAPDDAEEHAEELHKRRRKLCAESEARLGRVLTTLSAYRALLEQMTAELRRHEGAVAALPCEAPRAGAAE
jgi:hypothetical protein